MMPFFLPEDANVLLKIPPEKGELLALPPEFNVFVWNVYKGQRDAIFKEDFLRLGKGKEFLLLQEAVINKVMPEIWRQDFPAHEWNLAQSFQYKRDLTSTGVAIGSVLAPSEVTYLRSQSRELVWLTPKLTLFNKYKFEDREVLFVCTHVLNFVTLGAFTKSLYEIAERISKFEGPVILAGDFNTWNLKRYMVMKSIFRDLKLEHLDLEDDGRLLKLDHVFVRGFNVVTAKVHHKTRGSDHFPIDLKLKLK